MPAPIQPPADWEQRVSADKPKPVRHIYICQQSQSVKGQYSVSPHSEDVHPPKYDLPKADMVAEASSSANFETSSSAVNVTVWVHGEGDDDAAIARKPRSQKIKPVIVRAKTTMGNLKLDVPQYTCAQPLYIRAKSTNGTVHLHIPPTFSGMLSWQCDGQSTTGTTGLKLSKAIQERYTPLGEQRKHRGVGKIKPAPWVPQGEERGDSAELITAHGSLHLYDASETSDPSKCIVL